MQIRRTRVQRPLVELLKSLLELFLFFCHLSLLRRATVAAVSRGDFCVLGRARGGVLGLIWVEFVSKLLDKIIYTDRSTSIVLLLVFYSKVEEV